MRKLAELSVRYPTTVLMAVLAVIVLGLISFGRLGMDLFPRLDSPRLYVEIEAGERPPEEMETQFVSRLESLAARGRNVVNVISSSRVGKALITVEYQWNADMDEAFLDLQKSVGDFGSMSGADSITVSPLDPNARPVVTAAFRHDQIVSLDALRQTAETIIRNELVRLPGVAAVDLVGDRKREIVVRTDDFALQAYGLTMDALATTIQGFNSNLTGGSIVEMGIRYTIRGVGELSSLDDLRKLILVYKTTTQGGVEVRTPVTLADVAEVRYEESDRRTSSGSTALSASASRSSRRPASTRPRSPKRSGTPWPGSRRPCPATGSTSSRTTRRSSSRRSARSRTPRSTAASWPSSSSSSSSAASR